MFTLLTTSFHLQHFSMDHLKNRRNAFFAWKYQIDRQHLNRLVDKYKETNRVERKVSGALATLLLGQERGSLVSSHDIDTVLQLKLNQTVASETLNSLTCLESTVRENEDGHLQALEAKFYMAIEMFAIAVISDVNKQYRENTPPAYHWIIDYIVQTVVDLLSMHQRSTEDNPLLSAVSNVSNIVTSTIQPPAALHIEWPSKTLLIPTELIDHFDKKSKQTQIPLI